MTSSSLPPLRLGVVPYLNVQPLIWSLQQLEGAASHNLEIRSAPPRELAQQLERGEHHAAIVPIFEYLRKPDFYTIVPGVSIASRDEVYSVILYASCPLENIQRVHLDAASLTSVNLLRVLLAERSISPQYLDLGPDKWQPGSPLAAGDAALLIGDPAIHERDRHPFQYDLGLLWKGLTGLPFVFAAWLVHPSARELPLNQLLNDAKTRGVAAFQWIANERAPQFGSTPGAALRYFRENLCYDLGPAERQGITRFAELCQQHGLISQLPQLHLHQY